MSEELIDLHIKLLRKRKKWINKDKWEKSLVKYVHEYSNVDAWELERYGYKNVRLAIKIDVLKVWSTKNIANSNTCVLILAVTRSAIWLQCQI